MPNHDVRAIANEFLQRARDDGRVLTNMQLQKLPYIAHGWSLVSLPEPLVRELPQTWPYGPVYPPLYRDLKRYGAGAVSELIRSNNASPFPDERGEIVREEMTPNEQALIDQIWRTYGRLDGHALSRITHMPDTPWTLVTRQYGAFHAIDNETISAHYRDLRERNQRTSPPTAFSQ